VRDFDGNVRHFRAQRFVDRCFTKECVQFWVHCGVLLAVLVFSACMMVVVGYGTIAFSYYSGLFGLAVGGFMPAPKMKEPHSA
jgi:hypothetical protein